MSLKAHINDAGEFELVVPAPYTTQRVPYHAHTAYMVLDPESGETFNVLLRQYHPAQWRGKVYVTDDQGDRTLFEGERAPTTIIAVADSLLKDWVHGHNRTT